MPAIRRCKIPKLTRFNYFEFIPITPFVYSGTTIDSEQVSDYYRSQWEDGNEDALFAYAKYNRDAFRSEWVIKQIETWRDEASAVSVQNLRRLMNDYSSTMGCRTTENMLDMIQRDQEIFQYILTGKRKGRKLNDDMFPSVQEEYGVSVKEAKKVWNAYHHILKSHKEHCEKNRENKWLPVEDEIECKIVGFYPNYNYSDAGFLSYLALLLENLKAYASK